jgi:tape measure domain-containing protein
MATIDERVVSIAFENTVFEQRVATTMSTLSKLDASIKNIGTSSGLQNIEAQANKVTLQGPMSALDKLKAKLGLAGSGAAQGFSEIDKAGNKVTLEGPSRAVDKLQGKMGQLSAGSTFSDIEKASNQVQLSGMSQAIDGVAGKFNFLLNTASVALGGIAAQAAMKGAAFAKSFAFGPLTQGLQEYQTNLQSIQTILANTEGQQVSGLGATNKALGELNEYSDRTIYNFGEMAKNIGTFTAAGVDLPKSVESIKGIANLAALSGSSSQQAATAMYQLSQAIAAGRVGLQDWNSVVNAGMGGAKFQQALMRTAENMGALEKGAVKIDKATGKATVNGQSFRESIMAKPGEQSWLTSDVLTKTLGQFTGDMTDAQLAAQGFSKEQIKAIQSTAKTAQEAATQVKTLPQVFDVARESIGSGWAKTFQLIFGDFEQAKETFTGLSNFINGFIKKVSDARNKVLGEWSELGGRDALIDNIIIAWDNLERILKAVYEAFRQVFPPTTGEQLYDLTVMFGELMLKLTPSPQLLDNIRRIFAGLFAALHIGWTVIKEVVRVFFDLFGVIGKGSGGFLGFVASIGDFVVAIDKAITKGGALRGIFDALGAILKVPLELLKAVGSAIAGLFGGTDSGKANELGGAVENLGEKVKPLAGIVNGAKAAWEKFKDILGKIKEVVEPAFTKTIDFIADFGNKVTEAFESINWDTALQALQTGLIGGIFLKLRSALSGGLGVDVGGGMLEKIGDSFEALTGHLQTMQQNVQAGTLLKIAAAVGILAGAIFVISTIPPKKVSDAMAAIAIGMLQLIGGLALLSKVGGPMAFATLPLMATGLLILATAMVVLSGAMKIFATMSWEDIAQGLVGVGGSLVVVAGAVNLMNPVQLMAAGVAMIPLATGNCHPGYGSQDICHYELGGAGQGTTRVCRCLGSHSPDHVPHASRDHPHNQCGYLGSGNCHDDDRFVHCCIRQHGSQDLGPRPCRLCRCAHDHRGSNDPPSSRNGHSSSRRPAYFRGGDDRHCRGDCHSGESGHTQSGQGYRGSGCNLGGSVSRIVRHDRNPPGSSGTARRGRSSGHIGSGYRLHGSARMGHYPQGTGRHGAFHRGFGRGRSHCRSASYRSRGGYRGTGSGSTGYRSRRIFGRQGYLAHRSRRSQGHGCPDRGDRCLYRRLPEDGHRLCQGIGDDRRRGGQAGSVHCHLSGLHRLHVGGRDHHVSTQSGRSHPCSYYRHSPSSQRECRSSVGWWTQADQHHIVRLR